VLLVEVLQVYGRCEVLMAVTMQCDATLYGRSLPTSWRNVLYLFTGYRSKTTHKKHGADIREWGRAMPLSELIEVRRRGNETFGT
jgi:hypothetical protein